MSDDMTNALEILARRLQKAGNDKTLLEQYPVGTKVYGRKRSSYKNVFARTTGHFKHCHMAGCTGTMIRVKWPGGQIRWLCSKGLIPYRKNSKHWRLG